MFKALAGLFNTNKEPEPTETEESLLEQIERFHAEGNKEARHRAFEKYEALRNERMRREWEERSQQILTDNLAEEIGQDLLRKIEKSLPDGQLSEAVAMPLWMMLKVWIKIGRSEGEPIGDYRDTLKVAEKGIKALLTNIQPSTVAKAPLVRNGLFTPIGTMFVDPAAAVGAIQKVFENVTTDDEYLNHCQKQVLINEAHASNIEYGDLEGLARINRKLKTPYDFMKDCADTTTEELFSIFLKNTPFEEFPYQAVGYRPSLRHRFEHMHVLGGSGHGKTQLLQQFIMNDIERLLHTGQGSLFVIDSQGDLISNIMHLSQFSPGAKSSLSEQIILIDPNDMEHPPCLNLFDIGLDDMGALSAMQREKIQNAAIALYEFIFGSLLGAELTQRQSVIFRYLARLIMVIPGATIHTLREMLQEPERATPYIDQLDPTSKAFFETQFFSKSFDDTRQQILTRLWGILSNPLLERMFTNERNKFNLYQALNSNKIVLINTAKDLLKQDGCELLGRFFIALLTHATQERASIEPDKRVPTMVYVDEAQDYFDDNIDLLLSQARKYKVGVTIAHQNLGQFTSELRQSVMASTAIKCVGGASPDDRAKLAKAMNTKPDFIAGMKKRDEFTEFAFYIRNTLPKAIYLGAPFGRMESAEKLTDEEFEQLFQANRERICTSLDGSTIQQPSPSATSGKGSGFELGDHEML